MSGWLLRCSRLTLLLVPLPLAAGGQDAAARTAEFHRAHRLDLALEESRAIDDVALRAEWQFQVLYDAGDLPAALAAARLGLQADPDHLRLLQNALACALTLGHLELARELESRWARAIERPPLDEPARREAAETHGRKAGELEELLAREQLSRRAGARARWTALALLGACAALLGWLAFAPDRHEHG